MAHLDKATRLQVVGLITHDLRKCDNHTNEDIDPNRSYLNYNLKEGDPLENYNARISQIKVLNRKDVNTLGLFVCHLPKELENEPKNVQEDFFKSVYSFTKEDFGENNIVSAIVHNDETRPHIHIKFIPVVKDKKNEEIEKCSFKEKFKPLYYDQLHPRLQEHVSKDLQREVKILNGATIENKTIKQLKQQSKSEELERLNQRIEKQKDNLKKLLNEEKDIAKQLTSKRIEVLQPDKKDMFGKKQYIDYDEYVKAKMQIEVDRKLIEKKQEEIVKLKNENENILQDTINTQQEIQIANNNNKILQKENKRLKSRKGVKELVNQIEDLKEKNRELTYEKNGFDGVVETLKQNNQILSNEKDKLIEENETLTRQRNWYMDFYDKVVEGFARYKKQNKEIDSLLNCFDFGNKVPNLLKDIGKTFDKLFNFVKKAFDRDEPTL